MKEIQSAQRNKLSWKDLLSAGLALSQLHCCGLGYGGGLKNNNEITVSAANGALASPGMCEEHQSTESELTPERCPWLSEVTATRNTQLRALLHCATAAPISQVGCEQPLKCYVEGFSLFLKMRHCPNACLQPHLFAAATQLAQQCKFNRRRLCSSNTQ